MGTINIDCPTLDTLFSSQYGLPTRLDGLNFMPQKFLAGFLKPDSLWELATIGVDHIQRKKIHETKSDTKTASQEIYVRECLSHQHSPKVRIGLYEMGVPEGRRMIWEKTAEALACPLCWKIFKRYEDESEWVLPTELPINDGSDVRAVEKRKRA